MTDPRELEARANLRESSHSKEGITADYVSGIANVAYIVAREEIERAGIPLSPYRTKEERGMQPPSVDA